MSKYPTASTVLEQVQILLKECDEHKIAVRGFKTSYRRYRIREVCDRLSIFDWWNEYLSYSQLKSMEAFLKTAISMGYTGYACFKVGSTGCSHGMWAHKVDSTNGRSPDGDWLFHSFRCDMNDWDVRIGDHPLLCEIDHKNHTLTQVKAYIKKCEEDKE